MSCPPKLASWQRMRKELKSFLAPALAGRVDYSVTRYRKSHDGVGHAEILVDGKPVTNFCWISKEMRSCAGGWDEDARKYIPAPDFDPVTRDFADYDFLAAAGLYLNSPIGESLGGAEVLEDDDLRRHTGVLRQCLALMDRRVGKRTLQRFATEAAAAPEIVRFFYSLRCSAEGLARDAGPS